MQPTNHLTKSALLALTLTLLFCIGWETYWRNQDFTLGYDNDNDAWAAERRKVATAGNSATVIIGSSRAKFDIDLPTFRQVSGSQPIQLAMQGTCERPVLHDLADNSSFAGTVLIDGTEGLFFAPPGHRSLKEIQGSIAHTKRWSLAQQSGFHIGRVLEEGIVSMDKTSLNLDALLTRLPVPSRPGVWVFPTFPLNWTYATSDRQTKMTDHFLADTAMQRQMKEVWLKLGAASDVRGVGGDTLTTMMNDIKRSIDKIRARGGQVFFVRPPSDGKFWEVEQVAYPRDLYWERVLRETNTPGIHFADYPELSQYSCPEWSHLTPEDAVTFTEDLVAIMRQKGWKNEK